MLPAGIPTMLLGRRQHFTTFLAITILRVIGTTSGHSGYDFPWVPWDILPFKNTPTYHDFHHSGGDFAGNYSGQSWIIDTIWGTNKKYFR
jgi:sterol desaturase/sphingolipid hydroxylase (fatty acid hydroxylase superfamily)